MTNPTMPTPPVGDDKLAQVTREYIRIRDLRKANKKIFDETDGKLKVIQERLEGFALKTLIERKEDSAKTEYGTPYKSPSIKYSVDSAENNNREQLEEYVRQTGDLSIFGNTLNKEAIERYAKNNKGKLPPGVRKFEQVKVNFRAPTKKK